MKITETTVSPSSADPGLRIILDSRDSDTTTEAEADSAEVAAVTTEASLATTSTEASGVAVAGEAVAAGEAAVDRTVVSAADLIRDSEAAADSVEAAEGSEDKVRPQSLSSPVNWTAFDHNNSCVAGNWNDGPVDGNSQGFENFDE